MTDNYATYYMLQVTSNSMIKVTEKKDIQRVKKENDMIILKVFGVKCEKFFPQEHQCEK